MYSNGPKAIYISEVYIKAPIQGKNRKPVYLSNTISIG
jgi:hypothetical protein